MDVLLCMESCIRVIGSFDLGPNVAMVKLVASRWLALVKDLAMP